MAKVKVTTRFRIHELINRFVDGHTANRIGSAIVKEMKQSISQGISPVRGHTRFERYKDRTKYPGKIKPARPVNLNLSGKLVAALGFRQKTPNSLEVGVTEGTQRERDLARLHNAGTEHMAMRRIIPQDGEEFTVRIMRVVRELFGQRLHQLIKRANEKE